MGGINFLLIFRTIWPVSPADLLARNTLGREQALAARAIQMQTRSRHSQSLVYSGISTTFEIATKVTHLLDFELPSELRNFVFLFARSNKPRVTIFPGTCATFDSLR
jgi:hypothetical protein